MVRVFATGEEHGQFYVVMELVDGGSLDDRINDEEGISEKKTLEIGLQVATGLQAALQLGLIHRDIKPGNILFTDREVAKIVDFGLAPVASHHAETEGEIWGTPYYVAPERLTSEPEDFRSDIYSLGATLFHALSGRPIFENETQSAAELKKLKSHPVSLKKVAPDVSKKTAATIDRMLGSNPADRQTSYEELIAQLQAAHTALLKREQKLRGHWSWPKRLAASLGVLLLFGAVGFGILFGTKYLERSATSTPLPESAPNVQPPVAQKRLDQEETKIGAETAGRMTKRAAEDEQLAAETRQWQEALSKAQEEMAVYQFDDAVATLGKVILTSNSLQAQRDDGLQRARWLSEWKRKLIEDINGSGFGGAVIDVHGVHYHGPLRRATANSLELKTRNGSVLTDWRDLSPPMLLIISTAFIRPPVSDIPERQWLSAIFAAQTGQIRAANDLASKAAEAKPQFRDLRARFIPRSKK